MCKKLLSLIVFALFGFNMIGQTIVSTTPENKKVILEEFTGIHCVYCPQGHTIAQAIQNNNPGDAFLINIHQGSFATPAAGEPDFRTPFGNAIAGQSGLTGYPAGTVNRHVFAGMSMNGAGGTAMGRNFWTAAATQILAVNSYVNVGVEASINVLTNEITIHVEAYYTGNSPESTNLLNVALLQNNTKGPQIGGNLCDQYNHMHRLVHMITGQWGVNIPTTTTGTFVDETFTYTIPADYNGVPVVLADLEIVAYVAETHQEIISGNGAYPTFEGITNVNDANIKYIEEINEVCENHIIPQVNIQNTGQDPITSLAIEYSVNGGDTAVYNWTGNLTSWQDETIELPEIYFPVEATNTLEIIIPNDDVNSNNTGTFSFDKAPDATTTVDMVLQTDAYGSECRWNVKDYEGNTIYSGGPYGNNQTIELTFDLPSNCYVFNIIDTYGDGGGPVTLTDSDGLLIFSTNGVFGCGDSGQFSTDNFVMGTEENNLMERIVIYPNPASSILNIKNADGASVTIYDVLGKQMVTQNINSNEGNIDVSRFQTGTYFIKIMTQNGIKTETFLINN